MKKIYCDIFNLIIIIILAYKILIYILLSDWALCNLEIHTQYISYRLA